MRHNNGTVEKKENFPPAIEPKEKKRVYRMIKNIVEKMHGCCRLAAHNLPAFTVDDSNDFFHSYYMICVVGIRTGKSEIIREVRTSLEMAIASIVIAEKFNVVPAGIFRQIDTLMKEKNISVLEAMICSINIQNGTVDNFQYRAQFGDPIKNYREATCVKRRNGERI